ncbi:hypothetical protein FIBSPDRAFT_110622 [Athelia psychrophila]|uniref:Uncharacterized protein n=1 Tax=Athelia psychrophila TaxID=1759441 RepID=A0A166TE69_9AGAM|nr:hypothetical protein FIBSPDRAFT_110622 [Fibularhizoctonia sp. CBS 109695]
MDIPEQPYSPLCRQMPPDFKTTFLDKRAGDEIVSKILKHTTKGVDGGTGLITPSIFVLYCYTAGLCRNELFTSGKEQYGHQSQLPPERCNRPTRLDVSSRMPRSVPAHSPLSILSTYLYRMTNRMCKFLGGDYYLEARLYVQTTLWPQVPIAVRLPLQLRQPKERCTHTGSGAMWVQRGLRRQKEATYGQGA